MWVVRFQGKPLLPLGLHLPWTLRKSLVLGADLKCSLLKECRGTEPLFFPLPGPGTVDSQGQIEFLRCFATLKTKSQTKFYLEFHSSCLESEWRELASAGQALRPHWLFIECALPHLSLGRTPGWASKGFREVGLQVEVQGEH